jgi:antirestriction protein ArdC
LTGSLYPGFDAPVTINPIERKQTMATNQTTTATVVQPSEAIADKPVNPITGKNYFGAKAQRLLDEAAYRGYTSHAWATLKQWNSIKETIGKGEKGTLMIHMDKLPDGTEVQNRSFLYNRCQLVSAQY